MNSLETMKFIVVLSIFTTDLKLVSSKFRIYRYNGKVFGGNGNTESDTDSIPIWIGCFIGAIIITLILLCIHKLCVANRTSPMDQWIVNGYRNRYPILSQQENNGNVNRTTGTKENSGWNMDELINRYPNLSQQENNDTQQPKTHNMNIPYSIQMSNDGSTSVPSHKSILEYDSIKIPRFTIHK